MFLITKGFKILLCVGLGLIIFRPMVSESQEILLSRLANDVGQNNPNIDVLEAVARHLGVKLKLIRTPFKRALVMMKDGKLDILAGLLKNPDRETYIFYIQPPYKTRSDTVFFVPRGKADLIKDYDDLFPLQIGTTIGVNYFTRFDLDTLLSKEAVPNGENSFRKLLAGRIQTVVSSEGDGIELMDKMGIANKIEIARYRFSREKHVFIGLSKASRIRERIPDIDRIIKSMIESGEILRVFKAYYIRRNLPVPAF